MKYLETRYEGDKTIEEQAGVGYFLPSNYSLTLYSHFSLHLTRTVRTFRRLLQLFFFSSLLSFPRCSHCYSFCFCIFFRHFSLCPLLYAFRSIHNICLLRFYF